LSHRRSWRALLPAVALLAAVAAPAGTAAAAAPKGITLTATAAFPGVASPQAFRTRIPAEDLNSDWLTVVDRPDAATVVVEDRQRRKVRRNGRTVWVAAKACARGTLSTALVPEQRDPLALVRYLLPRAQMEVADRSRPGRGRSGDDMAFRIWGDTGAGDRKVPPGNERIAIYAEAWTSRDVAGLTGLAVTTMHTVRIRRTGSCAAATADPEDIDPVTFVAGLWMGGLQ